MNLSELQNLLYRLITAADSVDEAVDKELVLGEGGLERIIITKAGVPACERLGIYGNAYFYRLHDILKEDFPCTYVVLGEVNFHNLITGYLIKHPPSDPSVLYAGRLLPYFLRTLMGTADLSIPKLPFLADLAQLERAFIEVFHGRDAESLGQDRLRAIPPDSWSSLRIRLHPATQIVDSQWRIDKLMSAIRDGNQWEPPELYSVAILVWRQNWRAHYRVLDPGESSALKAVASGTDFASLCAAAADELQASAADLPAIINRAFTRWIQDGILVSA
jgi:Putative DNA-binding domain